MELQKNETEVNSKFQWFLFAGVIPFLFATVFALVILTIAGVNLFETAKEYGQHIPGISMLINGDKSEIDIEEKLRKDIVDLEVRNKDQVAIISKMQNEAEQNLQEQEKLQEEIDKLSLELKTLEEQKIDANQSINEIVKMFESMSAQNAANILSELNDQEVMKIMGSLSTEALGAIFEKMSPAEAAKFTEQLTKESSNQ